MLIAIKYQSNSLGRGALPYDHPWLGTHMRADSLQELIAKEEMSATLADTKDTVRSVWKPLSGAS